MLSPPLLKLYDQIRYAGISSNKKWYLMLKNNEELLVLRKLFRKKLRKADGSHIKLITEFLVSKDMFPVIEGTVVEKRVNDITKMFSSGLKLYKLRDSMPKRRMNRIEETFVTDDELSILIFRVLRIFELDSEIGETNSEIFHDWVLAKVLRKPMHCIPQFKAAEVKFIGAFKAKEVLRGLHLNEKNQYRRALFNNFMHGLFWFTLAAIRECIIPILGGPFAQNVTLVWRCGYLKIMKSEVKDFRRRYGLKRIRGAPNRIGSLQMRLLRQKLRPLFPKSCDVREKREQHEYWRLLLSRLRFLMEHNGIQFRNIRRACQMVRDFINRHQSETIYGFTADITKCFSNVDHRILLDSLQRMVADIQDKTIYSIAGAGNIRSGALKQYCCSAFSEEKAKADLNTKLARLERAEKCEVKKTTVKEVYETVCHQIKHYEFKHAKSYWRVERGVPQGHPLSSLLSGWYLESFQSTYWKQILKSAGDKLAFSRYEDDYIFCTTDKSIVEEMLAPLYRGENSYKLEMNKEKEQCSTDVLTWCGVAIHLKSNKFEKKIRLRNKMIVNMAFNLDD